MMSIPATTMAASTGTFALERRGWQMPGPGTVAGVGVRASLRMRRATPNVARPLPQGVNIGFFCTLRGFELADVVNRVSEALVGEGFRVSADADGKSALSAALASSTLEGKVRAIRALRAWRYGRLISPCRVIVFEEDDGLLTVGFMDPVAIVQVDDNKDVAMFAVDVRDRLQCVESALLAWAGAAAQADRGKIIS